MASGTSLATPIFAAMMALKQEQRKKVYGFAPPLFYKTPKAFRDIKPAKPFTILSDLDNYTYVAAVPSTSLVTAVGYDNLTGLGSPSRKFWKLL